MKVQSHRDLKVWQKAIDMTMTCYELTANFPDSERYGLTSQIRRAAVSVPANIAEGKGRSSTGAYINHIGIAVGSIAELDTHFEIALRLELITGVQSQTLRSQLDEIGRMLSGLRKSLS